MKRRKFIQAGIGAAAGFSGIRFPEKSIHPKLSPNSNRNAPAVTVKVLGSAQDGGLPQSGCTCSNCRRARQETSFSRLIVSLAIWDKAENKYFLIDASPDIRRQLEMVPFPPPEQSIFL